MPVDLSNPLPWWEKTDPVGREIPFGRIEYRPFVLGSKKTKEPPARVKVVGLDTEADSEGRTFLVCTPNRDMPGSELPHILFQEYPQDTNFVTWNINYEAGAILYWLPPERLNMLRVLGEVTYQEGMLEWYIRWIPNKELLVQCKGPGKKAQWIKHRFWDVFQYYTSSLDAAAKKYLGANKIGVETKTFTPEYIRKNWELIVAYCRKDALLTEQLAERLLDECDSWGVPANSLLSTASLSEKFFERNSNPYYMGRDFTNNEEWYRAAFLSYSGGLFHVYKKGYGHFYQYDLNSAYPWAMRQLRDLRQARYRKGAKRNPHADYSFLLCTLHIEEDIRHPIAVRWRGINIYPVGKIRRVITGPEYDFLLGQGVQIEIHEGWHIYCHSTASYLYRDAIDYLYGKKAELKASDNQVAYQLSKILMNSFYGKAMQLIPRFSKEATGRVLSGEIMPEDLTPEDLNWQAGKLWCPVYASYITAMVRVKVCETAQAYNGVCAALATDSIITTEPIPLTVGKELGEWDFQAQGEGLILGSGVYEIAGKGKFRGVHTNTSILQYLREQIPEPKSQFPDKLQIKMMRPYTWQEVAFRELPKEHINLFHEETKEVDINFEKRRIWAWKWRNLAEVLEAGIVDSQPIPWYHSDPRI